MSSNKSKKNIKNDDKPIVESDNDTSDSEYEQPAKIVDSDEEDKDIKKTVIDSDLDDEVETKKAIVDSDSDEEFKTEEVKTKDKKKETHAQIMTKINSYTSDIAKIDKEITEDKKQMLVKEKTRRDLDKQRNKLIALLPKAEEESFIRGKKEKPKRKGNSNSGFNKLTNVPKVLVDYLNLDENKQFTRPAIMSALNTKFKDDGLKNGQVTTLTKEVSNKLGFGNKYEKKEIKFNEFQKFLAEIYASDTSDSKTTVSV